MSTTIDNRVVEMRFDNEQFERNASKSISTLERLKQALKFDKSSTSGLDNLERNTKNFKLDSVAASVDKISDRFSNMGIIGVTALQRITNAAITMGERLIKSVTTDQVNSGFSKYEAKINAVQVMMVNTGASIDVVNEKLQKLQHYTDETSYSYSQMVDAIGKFTTAGVPLAQAEEMAEGIANWAATAGVNASRASIAFYNLSQAVGAGALKTIDAKSIQQLNMFTRDFNQTALDTAVALGTVRKEGERYFSNLSKTELSVSNLTQNLSDGWLNIDVLSEVLHKYADTTEEFGQKAYNAAYEAKTFTDAIEAVKDSMSSGWSQTFEHIFGNYEEAKTLWTSLANLLTEFTGAIDENRNALLEEWKAFGGRDFLILAFAQAFQNLLTVLSPIKEAFDDIFPATTGERLAELTSKFRDLMRNIAPTHETLESIYYAAQGVFQVAKSGLQVLKAVATTARPLVDIVGKLLGNAIKLAGVLGILVSYAMTSLRESGKIERAVSVIGKGFSGLFSVLGGIVNVIVEFVKAVAGMPVVQEIFTSIVTGLEKFYGILTGAFSKAAGEFSGFINTLKGIKKEDIAPYLNRIGQAFQGLWNILLPVRKGINSLLDSLSGKGNAFGSAAKGTSLLAASLGDFLKGGSVIDSISKKIDSLKNATKGLSTFEAGFHDFVTKIVQRARELDIARIIVVAFGAAITVQMLNLARAFSKLPTLMKDIHTSFTELKKTIRSFNQARDSVGDTIIKIAAAIAILAGSVFLLSRIDSGSLKSATMSLLALIAVFGILAGAMIAVASIDKIANNFEKASTGVIEIAGAVGILVASLKVMDSMHPMKIEQNIKFIAELIGDMMLVGFLFSKFDPAAKSNALVMIGFALALYKTVEAVAKLAAFPESQIRAAGDSIAQLMLLLTGLTLAVSKIKFGAGAGLVAIVTSLYLLEGALWTVAKLGIDADTVIQNIDKFIIVFSVLAGLLAMTRLAGANAMGAGVAAMGLGVALLSMSAVLAIMAGLAALNPDALLVGVMGLIGLMGGVYIMMQAISNTEKASLKAGAALVPMSLALVLMAGAVKLLSSIPPEALPAGLAAVGILTLFAAGLTAVSEMSAKAKFAPIVAMAAAVIAITGSLALLSMADTQGLGAAAGALMLVLLSFAGAMASATTMVEKINFAAIAGFVTMIGILVASSTALATLANLPWQGLIAAAGAISMLMGTMALVGSFAQVGLGTAVALTALSVAMVPLAFALMLLQGVKFEDVIQGIAGIGVAFAVLIAAGFLAGLGPVTTGLFALVVVMGAFSLAALGFSQALTGITNALILFGQNGPMITMSILSTFTALGNGINYVFTSIGTGLANTILSFFGTLKDGIVNGIDSIITAITGKQSDIAAAGTSLIGGLVSGIIAALPGPVQAAISVVGAVAEVFTGGGLFGTMFAAGADATNGLAQGMAGTQGVAEAAGAQLGVSAENGLRNAVGWHSPWLDMIMAGKDAVLGLAQGFSDNSSVAEIAAGAVGAAAGDAAGANALASVNSYRGAIANALAGMFNGFGGVSASTTKAQAQQRKREADEAEIWAKYQERENAKKQQAEIEKMFSGGGAGAGGKGKGGGGGGSTKDTTKQVKKLFDVMKDGGKIVQKFGENFGVAYQNISNTHPLQIGKEAVQKLAEAIYAESTKSMDATELAAKTSEEKLAEMRDAFISFYDNVKGKISGAVDEFGKFAESSAKFSDFASWNRALDRQKSSIVSWEQELRLLAKRSQNFNLLKMVVNWGPEQIRDLRLLNSMTENELQTISKKMLEAGQSYGDAYADMIMASAAYTTSGLENIYESSNEVVANATEETAEEINKTAEDQLGKFTTITQNGAAVVSKAQSTIINGNNNAADSFKKVITVTDQLRSKVTSIYSEIRDTVESAVGSNFNIFEKFDKETELTGEELLENMESRIHGTREWQSGISELIAKGLNDGLAKKLMEEGTASYDKVQAMLEWSESEINKANALFEQSLTIASEVADALGKDMATVGVAAAEGFVSGFGSDTTKNSMLQAARDAVNVIVGEFNDPNSGTAQAAGAAAEGFSTGMSNNQSVVDQSLLNVVNKAEVVWAAGAEKSMTYVAGKAIDGFVDAIRSPESRAKIESAVSDVVGGGAEEGAEERLEINSPSRVFAKIGEYTVLGFVKGLYDNSRLIDNASEGITSSAIESMKTVVGHIADIINGEVQVDPTIRPVMDLSNVQAGASAIGSMFGGQSYSMSRGIGFQNPNASINDLMGQMMAIQMAMATAGGAPINMYVYAAPGQSEEEIANIVEQKLMFRINRQGGVWK